MRQPNIGLVTRVENLPRRLERLLEDVEMDTTKITREAEKAQAGLVDVFPRAGELAEVRATRDRLAAELTADEHATGHDPATAANGSRPERPAIAPSAAPPHRPDSGTRTPEAQGWSR